MSTHGTQRETVAARPAMSLIWLVAKREITSKLKDKTYLISIGFFIVLILAVVGINVATNSGSNDFTVGVVGQTSQTFQQAIKSGADQFDGKVTLEYTNEADGKTKVKNGDFDALVVGDTIITKDTLNTTLGAVLQGANKAAKTQQQIESSGIDPQKLDQALTVPPMQTQALNPDAKTNFERGIIAIIAVGVAYGMLMIVGQFVAQGVVEEKSSRVIELLMAVVKPWQLLTGKLIGLGILGILQLVLVVGLGLAGVLSFNLIAVPSAAVGVVLQVVPWFILGYTLFAAFFALAASLVSRQEDLGSAVMPVTLVPIFAFFAAFQVVSSPNSTFATIISMVPGFSPTTMPVRAVMVSVPIWQYVIAVILQVIAIVLVVRLAGRVYAGSMLRTSGKIKLKDALKQSKETAGTPAQA
ncbi:MAG: ABC transporter permease [Antricoccus sp.]